MYLNIIFLPLISAILCGFGGFLVGAGGAGLIGIVSIFITFGLSCVALYEVGLCGAPCFITLFPWFNSDFFSVNWGFQFDSLTVVMLVVVSFISLLVHLYSTEYMSHDPHLPRFMAYLSLFTFFMLILITADNFVQLFVGWEGVGLCSYLLINFWFTRIQANKAAIKAMILNRVGDVGLALGIFTIYLLFNSVEYATVFAIAPLLQDESFVFCGISFSGLNLIGLLLFIGAMGKSAQLGLHTWLPDAMEGPTPVSALIHAATMVTAGIFLLARCSPIFEYASFALMVITFIGAATAFFAATTGLVQNDLKRVIAYSTCSQLGYMIFACGLSNYSVGVFHLSNHAFFKALLFLGAGSVIHAVADEQDMRRMGGLRRLLPLTFSLMLIGSLALMGFPFLTGFYSKDIILESVFARYSELGFFAYCLGTGAAFCTAFYSMRLVFLTFLSEPNGFKLVVLGAFDSPWRIALPLLILAFPSIFIGYFTKDFFIGVGTPFWNNALFVFPTHLMSIDCEFILLKYKLLPLVFSLSGLGLGYILYVWFTPWLFTLKISWIGRSLYTFLNRKWFFDKIYNETFNQLGLHWGYHLTYKGIDRGLIEMLGPYGVTTILVNLSRIFQKFHVGSVYTYAFWIFLSVVWLTLLSFAGGVASFTWMSVAGTFFLDSDFFFLVLVMVWFSFFSQRHYKKNF